MVIEHSNTLTFKIIGEANIITLYWANITNNSIDKFTKRYIIKNC